MKYRCIAWKTLSFACFLGLSINVSAQEGPIEEVIVTGSYIKGSAEDAALPIDVITNEDLEDIGNPSMIEFIRTLDISHCQNFDQPDHLLQKVITMTIQVSEQRMNGVKICSQPGIETQQVTLAYLWFNFIQNLVE